MTVLNLPQLICLCGEEELRLPFYNNWSTHICEHARFDMPQALHAYHSWKYECDFLKIDTLSFTSKLIQLISLFWCMSWWRHAKNRRVYPCVCQRFLLKCCLLTLITHSPILFRKKASSEGKWLIFINYRMMNVFPDRYMRKGERNTSFCSVFVLACECAHVKVRTRMRVSF